MGLDNVGEGMNGIRKVRSYHRGRDGAFFAVVAVLDANGIERWQVARAISPSTGRYFESFHIYPKRYLFAFAAERAARKWKK